MEPSVRYRLRAVALIEPFEACNETTVTSDFVGLTVKSKDVRTDHIFSSTVDGEVTYENMSVNATYAIVSDHDDDFTLFMGNVTLISANGFTIRTDEKTDAVLEQKGGRYSFSCDAPLTVTTDRDETVRMGLQPASKS